MYKKSITNNGLKLIVSPMPQMASVSLGVWIGIGGRYESEKNSGISHLVEHMLFKGTDTRSTKDLKEAIEGVGGMFNGFTSDEVTCYMVKVPARYMELGMDVLSDMVLNARFDEDDLGREKYVVCEEIKMYRDLPSEHVLDVLGSIMWPGDALGRPLTGTMTTVKNLKRKDLIKFRDDNYHPGNITVVAAGKVTSQKAFKEASERFKGRVKKKKPSFKPSRPVQRSSRMKICKGEASQVHIAMGFHVNDKNIRERYAIKIMNVILGGNMSSRLFEELREKHGLCYDISSSYKRHSDIGEVNVHAGVDRKKAGMAVVAILDELERLRDIGVTDEELDRAKKYAKGQFLLAMEGTSTRMLWLGDSMVVHNHIPDLKYVLKRIDEVTPKEIQKVSEDIFKSSALNLAMVGKISDVDKKKIRKQLSKL